MYRDQEHRVLYPSCERGRASVNYARRQARTLIPGLGKDYTTIPGCDGVWKTRHLLYPCPSPGGVNKRLQVVSRTWEASADPSMFQALPVNLTLL